MSSPRKWEILLSVRLYDFARWRRAFRAEPYDDGVEPGTVVKVEMYWNAAQSYYVARNTVTGEIRRG